MEALPGAETVSWEAVNQELAAPLRHAMRVCNQNTISSASLAYVWRTAILCCPGAHQIVQKAEEVRVERTN